MGQLPGDREGQQPLQQGFSPTVPKQGKQKRSSGHAWFNPWLSSSTFSVRRAGPRASKKVNKDKNSIIKMKFMQRPSTKASSASGERGSIIQVVALHFVFLLMEKKGTHPQGTTAWASVQSWSLLGNRLVLAVFVNGSAKWNVQLYIPDLG